MRRLLAALLVFSGLATAGEIELSWNANAESDVVAYEIGVGSASGDYSQKFLVLDPVVSIDETTGARRVSYTVQLPDGQAWFSAVRAITDQGVPSAYSNEISFGVPAAPEGYTFKMTIELVPLPTP